MSTRSELDMSRQIVGSTQWVQLTILVEGPIFSLIPKSAPGNRAATYTNI